VFRLREVSRAIWTAVPDAAAEPLGVVTALGGASVLLVGLSVLYWLGDRCRALTVVSYAVLALALVLAVKAALGWPRPPADVRLIPLANDPYGFPSGHAVAAVVVYGGLATVHERLDDRRVVAVLVPLVAAVALSRVALGMHYLGDVLAGTLFGIALLVGCWRLIGLDPARGFLTATLGAAVALVVAGVGSEALLAFGGGAGGALASRVRTAVPALRSRLEGIVLVVLGVPGVFALDELATAVASPVLSTLAYAGLVAGVVLLPAAVGRLPLPAVGRVDA